MVAGYPGYALTAHTHTEITLVQQGALYVSVYKQHTSRVVLYWLHLVSFKSYIGPWATNIEGLWTRDIVRSPAISDSIDPFGKLFSRPARLVETGLNLCLIRQLVHD